MKPENELQTLGARARQAISDWQAPSILAGLTAVANYRVPNIDDDIRQSARAFERNEDIWGRFRLGAK
jgi:hypothetical protein